MNTASALLLAARAEVVRHHDHIALWLNGGHRAASNELLASIVRAHDDAFVMIGPSGADPALQIEISDVVVVAGSEDLVVVGYVETHRRPPEEDVSRYSTVVFRRHDGDKFTWLHLQETWLVRD